MAAMEAPPVCAGGARDGVGPNTGAPALPPLVAREIEVVVALLLDGVVFSFSGSSSFLEFFEARARPIVMGIIVEDSFFSFLLLLAPLELATEDSSCFSLASFLLAATCVTRSTLTTSRSSRPSVS